MSNFLKVSDSSEILDAHGFHVLCSAAVDFAVFLEGGKGGDGPFFGEDGDDVVVRVEEDAGERGLLDDERRKRMRDALEHVRTEEG